MSKVGRLHHIGYMVKDIHKAVAVYEGLDYVLKKAICQDGIRKARICFLEHKFFGGVIELVEPEKDSEIYPLMKKYKGTAYHLCYEVESLADSIKVLQEQGFLLFKDRQLAPAIGNMAQVAFLMNPHIGMIELVENP